MYRYKLIYSQLATLGFVSPRASESALSYTHRIHNTFTIMAHYRTLNLTTHYWRQIYSNLQLSCFAIYWMESISCYSRLSLIRPDEPGKGWLLYVHSVDGAPIYGLLVTIISLIWLCISRDATVVKYWRHIISPGMNHGTMIEQSFGWRLGRRLPAVRVVLQRQVYILMHSPRSYIEVYPWFDPGLIGSILFSLSWLILWELFSLSCSSQRIDLPPLLLRFLEKPFHFIEYPIGILNPFRSIFSLIDPSSSIQMYLTWYGYNWRILPKALLGCWFLPWSRIILYRPIFFSSNRRHIAFGIIIRNDSSSP